MEPIREFQGEFRFLSNFWPALIYLDGIWFPSVEHAYQAAKTLDHNARKAIAANPNPGQAKRTGRHLHIRPEWDAIKVEMMEELVLQKFTTKTDLAQKLIATQGRTLIEGNLWGDTFWGVCKGQGENHLGKILMRVRHQLLEIATVGR